MIMSNSSHPTATFIISDDPTLGLPSHLERHSDAEWEDTAATFSPDVLLAIYPDVTPHPTATGYGVGMGDLIAVNDAGQQIAVWLDSAWQSA
jgi:hypothetical protein